MGKGKRDKEKEPVPTVYHWRQEFVIDQQNNVRIINKASELDVDRDIPVVADPAHQSGQSFKASDIILSNYGKKCNNITFFLLWRPNEAFIIG